jgi:flagellar basal body-associated protein FliL
MGFYAILSLILKILVSIVNYSSKKALWNVNIFSIIVILAFSIAISVCILYLKTKNTATKLMIYFFGIGTFYYILTVTVGGLAVGNALILIISAYVASFSLVATAIAVVSSRKKKKERDSKPYQNQF